MPTGLWAASWWVDVWISWMRLVLQYFKQHVPCRMVIEIANSLRYTHPETVSIVEELFGDGTHTIQYPQPEKETETL